MKPRWEQYLATKKATRQRRQRWATFFLVLLSGLLWMFCTSPHPEPLTLAPQHQTPALPINAAKAVPKTVDATPQKELSRPQWPKSSHLKESFLLAVSRVIQERKQNCRLTQSVRWEFIIDTKSGRLLQHEFLQWNGGALEDSSELGCLQKEWSGFRFEGPERYPGGTVRLSYVFRAVDDMR